MPKQNRYRAVVNGVPVIKSGTDFRTRLCCQKNKHDVCFHKSHPLFYYKETKKEKKLHVSGDDMGERRRRTVPEWGPGARRTQGGGGWGRGEDGQCKGERQRAGAGRRAQRVARGGAGAGLGTGYAEYGRCGAGTPWGILVFETRVWMPTTTQASTRKSTWISRLLPRAASLWCRGRRGTRTQSYHALLTLLLHRGLGYSAWKSNGAGLRRFQRGFSAKGL